MKFILCVKKWLYPGDTACIGYRGRELKTSHVPPHHCYFFLLLLALDLAVVVGSQRKMSMQCVAAIKTVNSIIY